MTPVDLTLSNRSAASLQVLPFCNQTIQLWLITHHVVHLLLELLEILCLWNINVLDLPLLEMLLDQHSYMLVHSRCLL